MKQTPLLNLLNMQPPTAAPRPGSQSGTVRDEFSQALSAAAPAVRQAPRPDQQGGDNVDARPSAATSDRTAQPNRPDARATAKEQEPAEAGLHTDTAAKPVAEETQVDESVLVAWQSLDATQQQRFMDELNRLLQQLEQGDLHPQAAVGVLQQLLETYDLAPDTSVLMTDAVALLQQDTEEPAGKLAQLLQQLSQKLDAGTLAAQAAPAPDVAVAPVVPGNNRNQSTVQTPSPLTAGERTAAVVSPAAVAINTGDDAAPDSDRMPTSSLGELKKAEPLSLAGKSFTLTGASLEGPGLAERTPLTAVAGGTVHAAPLVAAPVPSERGFTVQTMVNTLVGQPGWSQEVGQRVSWLARQNIAEAQLRLDPPDLGPVHVKITVQNDQAQVVFTTHTPGVREALDQSAQRLRELFAEQGLDLVNVDVSDQSQAGSEQAESGLSGGVARIEDEVDDHQQHVVIEGRLSMIDHYA